MTKAIIKIGDVEFEAEAVGISIFNGHRIDGQAPDVEVLLPGEHSRVCDCHDCMLGRTINFRCTIIRMDEE